ncbi:hypothetical protein [Thiospirillum jenense]|uniref:Uncharacterized protein n=1 Tax=Thiospirillum jenense TaxID=1653858 RepID=A0A839H2I6_9GAMM|nr:hypothetical protein [Thiospirillum jenense]MBB1124703.1 hypothetical protein [Thiospirillum jenense]
MPARVAGVKFETHQRVRAVKTSVFAALVDTPQSSDWQLSVTELRSVTLKKNVSVTRPDVIVICFAPEGDRIVRAPALIAEVVSILLYAVQSHLRLIFVLLV